MSLSPPGKRPPVWYNIPARAKKCLQILRQCNKYYNNVTNFTNAAKRGAFPKTCPYCRAAKIKGPASAGLYCMRKSAHIQNGSRKANSYDVVTKKPAGFSPTGQLSRSETYRKAIADVGSQMCKTFSKSH